MTARENGAPPLQLLCDAEVYAPQHVGLRHLMIAGGRIAWLGETRPRLPAELGASVRELHGCRLIPGLIDGHAHITGGGGELGPQSAVSPLSATAFTDAGITTVVGVLGTDDVTRSPETLVARSRALEAEGITAFCYTGSYRIPPVTVTGSVRRDLALIDRVVGVGEVAISDPRSSQPTLEEFLRTASDAHVGGMLGGKASVMHVHVGDGPAGLEMVRRALEGSELPARLFHPTHVNRRRELFEEALVLAAAGSTIDLTTFPVSEDEDAWSAEDALVRFLDAGLPPERVTVSSDAGGSLPTFGTDGRITGYDIALPATLSAALEELLCRGQPLERVLPAFTSNVADVLGLRRKGRIATGGDADLVLLDRAGRVAATMAGGQWRHWDAERLRTTVGAAP